jgi:hypothetical protein
MARERHDAAYFAAYARQDAERNAAAAEAAAFAASDFFGLWATAQGREEAVLSAYGAEDWQDLEVSAYRLPEPARAVLYAAQERVRAALRAAEAADTVVSALKKETAAHAEWQAAEAAQSGAYHAHMRFKDACGRAEAAIVAANAATLEAEVPALPDLADWPVSARDACGVKFEEEELEAAKAAPQPLDAVAQFEADAERQLQRWEALELREEELEAAKAVAREAAEAAKTEEERAAEREEELEFNKWCEAVEAVECQEALDAKERESALRQGRKHGIKARTQLARLQSKFASRR